MTDVGPDTAIATPSIARRSAQAREDDAVSFKALRNLGVDRVQAASGRRWTDYNLHDPGVTILEQLCYALTELAYRADLPVADHLCGPDGAIDFHRQCLFPPEAILPCRPTTANDYRRLLLDRIPGLADVRFVAPEPSRSDLAGLHHLRLRLSAGEDDEATSARYAAHVRAVYRTARTLGEDLCEDVPRIVPRPCVLRLDASIAGTREPAEILADIYRACATAIAGLPRRSSLAQQVAAGRPLEEVLEGPSMTHGLIEEAELPQGPRGRLVISELRTIVLAVEGVAEVSRLEVLGEGLSGSAPEWPADDWAPRLRVPGTAGLAEDLELLSHITLTRRGQPVAVDARAVARRQASANPRLTAASPERALAAMAPAPRGVRRSEPAFRSVQEEFPAIYGLGQRAAAVPEGQAATRQLAGYLALFDQLLANGRTQVAHIRDLFSTADLGQSYWRHILTDADVPGIEALRSGRATDLAKSVYAPFDTAAERRSRAFDYLLALYGETCAQNSLRQFLDYLDSRELAAALLDNKAEYLRQTVLLGRDRAAGFDIGVDLWRTPAATPGYHRKLCLLMGFRSWRARSLTAWATRWRLNGALAPTASTPDQATTRPAAADDALGGVTWPLSRRSSPATAQAMRRLRREQASHADLLVHGVNRERYRWRPNPRGKAGRLVLVDESERPCQDLGAFGQASEAAHLADTMRRRLLRLNDACEGLHLVEHVLLRPRGQPRCDAGFHSLRVTVVLPDWTARTSRPDFRAFAEETVQINTPSHVAAECLWLDFPAMRAFERLYAAWARQLRLYERAAERSENAGAATIASLDRAAGRLTAALQRALADQAARRSATGG